MRLSSLAVAVALLSAAGALWFYFRGESKWFAISPATLNAAVADLEHLPFKSSAAIFCHEIHADGKIVVAPACANFLESHPSFEVCAFQNLERGNWQASVLSADPASTADRVAETANALQCKHVLLDFESLTDRGAFTNWVQRFGSVVRGRSLTLTIAVHAKTDDAGTWAGAAAQDWPALCANSDELLLMAYDFHFPGTGAAGETAPLDWVTKVLRYAISVCPPKHLRLGLAAYGYKWPSKTVITERELNSTAELPAPPYFVETKVAREQKERLARSFGVDRFFLWALGMTPPL